MKNNHYQTEKTKLNLKDRQKLGFILREADLISDLQLKTALEYQRNFPFLCLGEILSCQGWADARTCNFFASKWHKLVKSEYRKPLGYYLLKAGLLEKSEIKNILSEQQSTPYRFGTIAVMKGYVKPATIDFFLKYLFPEELGLPPLRTLESLLRSKKRQYIYYSEALKRRKLSKTEINNKIVPHETGAIKIA